MIKMKNKISLILWSLMIVLVNALSGCSKEEALKFLGYDLDVVGSADTNVELYLNEQDFWNRENVIFSGTIEQNPDTTLWSSLNYHSGQPEVYWMYVYKGDFNNLRDGNSCSQFSGLPPEDSGGKYFTPTPPPTPEVQSQNASNGYSVTCFPSLSLTPTRLEIQVLNNTIGVEDAEVQLYFSEEAHVNNLTAQEDADQLTDSYTHFPPADENIFKQATDKDGYVLFDNLEPKQYWFRITKDGLTNDAGTINLNEALPDDMNITTSITVGIN